MKACSLPLPPRVRRLSLSSRAISATFARWSWISDCSAGSTAGKSRAPRAGSIPIFLSFTSRGRRPSAGKRKACPAASCSGSPLHLPTSSPSSGNCWTTDRAANRRIARRGVRGNDGGLGVHSVFDVAHLHDEIRQPERLYAHPRIVRRLSREPMFPDQGSRSS